MCLPVVGEDVLIVSVSLSGLLSELSDALLLSLISLVDPHQPHLQEVNPVRQKVAAMLSYC